MTKNISLQLEGPIYKDLERISRMQHVSFKFIILAAIKDRILDEKRKKNLTKGIKGLAGLVKDIPDSSRSYKKILYG